MFRLSPFESLLTPSVCYDWHANRKLEPVVLVVADQPGADGDDSALQVDAALDSIHNKRGGLRPGRHPVPARACLAGDLRDWGTECKKPRPRGSGGLRCVAYLAFTDPSCMLLALLE